MLKSRRIKCEILREIREKDYDLDNKNKLRDLFFSKLKYPVVERSAVGIPSVKISCIRKLAKAVIPSCRYNTYLKEDIVAEDGEVLVNAKRLNNCKYPIAYLVLRYLECKRAEKGVKVKLNSDDVHMIVEMNGNKYDGVSNIIEAICDNSNIECKGVSNLNNIVKSCKDAKVESKNLGIVYKLSKNDFKSAKTVDKIKSDIDTVCKYGRRLNIHLILVCDKTEGIMPNSMLNQFSVRLKVFDSYCELYSLYDSNCKEMSILKKEGNKGVKS